MIQSLIMKIFIFFKTYPYISSMKPGSFLLLIYLLLLMAFPIHNMEDCNHHEHDHQESTSGEVPDCCPPFSFCKLCSHFVNEEFSTLKLELPQPLFTIERLDQIQLRYITVEVPFWHPPKIS